MIDPSRFALSEHKNQDWVMTVEEGTSLDDVMNPAFMANIAPQVRPYDRIRVRIDTGEWYAELLVLNCDRTWVQTFKVVHIEFNQNGEAELPVGSSPLENYTVQHKGPHLKFCVIRKTDKAVLRDCLATKAEANSWLENHLRSLLI